jgi:hypothetical protein
MRYGTFSKDGKLVLQSWSDIEAELADEAAFQATLEPSDPRHRQMFKIDHELDYLDVYWGGYEYSYELSRLATPLAFLEFLEHVLEKNWKHASGARVGELVRTMARHNGWGRHGLQDEKPQP